MVLIKKMPPVGHELMILGTTSSIRAMERSGLGPCCNASFTMPSVQSGDEVDLVSGSVGSDEEKDLSQSDPIRCTWKSPSNNCCWRLTGPERPARTVPLFLRGSLSAWGTSQGETLGETSME